MGSERFNKMARQYKAEVEGNPTPTTMVLPPEGTSALGNTPEQAAIMRQIQSGQLDLSQPRQMPPERTPPSMQQQLMDMESMQEFEKDPMKKQQMMEQYSKIKALLGR